MAYFMYLLEQASKWEVVKGAREGRLTLNWRSHSRPCMLEIQVNGVPSNGSTIVFEEDNNNGESVA